jgi:hypothetical protein
MPAQVSKLQPYRPGFVECKDIVALEASPTAGSLRAVSLSCLGSNKNSWVPNIQIQRAGAEMFIWSYLPLASDLVR